MKTKAQLFEAAMEGSSPNRVLFEILDVTTDLRNVIIACKLEDEGMDIGTMSVEMRRVYREEVEDEENKETKVG